MKDIIINHFISAISGGCITAIVWLAKSIYRAKRDIDFAHEKIRNIEKFIKKEGQTCHKSE